MSQGQILQSRRFLPLFVTQFLGAFNDNLLRNAVIMLITSRGLSLAGLTPAQLVAVVGGVFVLPYFVFSAQAGQLADKFDKRTIIRAVKLVEVAIMILATVGFLQMSLPVLLLSTACMGVHSAFFGPVKYSILPQHLTDDEIVGGNALIEAGTFVAVLIGSILGGVLVLSLEQSPYALPILLLATGLFGCVSGFAVPSAAASAPNLRIQFNPITPTIEILRRCRRNPTVFRSIWGISWFWFLGAAFLSLFPTYATQTLGLGESVVTLFLSLFSIGIAVGSLLCERLSRWHLELGLVPFGSIGISLFAADIFFAGVPNLAAGASIGEFLGNFTGARIAFDLFMFAVFSGFFVVPLFALIQLRSEPAERSRVVAANNIINALTMVIASGYLVVCFSNGMSAPVIMLTFAVMNVAVALHIYLLIPEFLLRFWIWGLANIVYRLRVTGERNVPKSGAAILISNHVSFVDWMIIAAGVKRPACFVMHYGFARGFLMKRLMKRAKIIPIASAKEDPQVMEQAFQKVAAELRDGNLVCIFPEGKITHDGSLNPFRPGIARIISETPVPVVPMAIVNMWGSYFSRKDKPQGKVKLPKRFWSRVSLQIGPAIPAAEVSAQILEDRVVGLLGEKSAAQYAQA